MKKLLVALVASFVIALAGCSAPQESAQPQEEAQEKAAPAQLQIITVGYSADAFGYVSWYAKGINPNEGYAIEQPCFRAIAYDTNGNVLDSQEYPIYLSSNLVANPGQTFGFSGALSVGDAELGEVVVQPVTVEESGFVEVQDESPVFEVTNSTVNVDSVISLVSAAGEVSNPTDEPCRLEVGVNLLDAGGNIVNNGATWVENVPANGSLPFSIDLMSTNAEYATAEFYALQDLNG